MRVRGHGSGAVGKRAAERMKQVLKVLVWMGARAEWGQVRKRVR